MLHKMLRYWVWAGIADTQQNFTHIRLTNVIALIVLFVLALQLPIALTYWQSGGQHKAMLLMLHLSALLIVPLFNHKHFHASASFVLITVYTSYLAISCLQWQVNLNVQYFLLLGTCVVPFLFASQQNRYVWLSISLLCVGFFSLEYTLSQPELLAASLSDYQLTVRQTNALFLMLAAILCAVHIRRNINNSLRKLVIERQRSENLLLNILPCTIAERLKEGNTLVADYFEQASILFADIQGFTKIAKQRSPQDLVAFLNDVFTQFDRITQKYKLEKIKTIGDEYMAVAGVPEQSAHHAESCCRCAQEMRQSFAKICDKHQITSALRIGIGSGEVVAGVIGKNKFSYDLWGDAVNMASRMESQGQGHRIQVTESTYHLAKDKFIFTRRGDLSVKGIGLVPTYWLEQ